MVTVEFEVSIDRLYMSLLARSRSKRSYIRMTLLEGFSNFFLFSKIFNLKLSTKENIRLQNQEKAKAHMPQRDCCIRWDSHVSSLTSKIYKNKMIIIFIYDHYFTWVSSLIHISAWFTHQHWFKCQRFDGYMPSY